MSTVPEIQEAIRHLAPEDLAEFRAWFADFEAHVWDSKFEQDATAGRLEGLADEALDDLRQGRCADR